MKLKRYTCAISPCGAEFLADVIASPYVPFATQLSNSGWKLFADDSALCPKHKKESERTS